MVAWLILLPHCKKVVGSIPRLEVGALLCGARSPWVCVGFLLVLRFHLPSKSCVSDSPTLTAQPVAVALNPPSD